MSDDNLTKRYDVARNGGPGMSIERGEKMAGSVDTLTVSGINWSQAMENAVQALARSDQYADRNMMKQEAFIQYVQANSSLAQAWVAVAREITMHARAAG